MSRKVLWAQSNCKLMQPLNWVELLDSMSCVKRILRPEVQLGWSRRYILSQVNQYSLCKLVSCVKGSWKEYFPIYDMSFVPKSWYKEQSHETHWRWWRLWGGYQRVHQCSFGGWIIALRHRRKYSFKQICILKQLTKCLNYSQFRLLHKQTTIREWKE